MRKITFLLAVSFLGLNVIAQNGVRDAAVAASRVVKNEGGKKIGAWTKGGMFSLNLNQGGFDNWIPAGDADWSIGLNGYLNAFANKAWLGKKQGKSKVWTNNLDIYEAIMNVHNERTDVNAFNKLDDRIDFLSRYSVQLKKKLSFATVLNLRTQLYDTKNSSSQRISGFFAPATITLSPGLEYKPCDGFSVFFSPLAMRWVIISNQPYSLMLNLPNAKPYGVDPTRRVDIQPGAYAQFRLDKNLDKAKKINLKSRLDLYSNYAGNLANIDVLWDNFLSLKVNKWISAGISLTMIYDDDIKQFGWNRDKPGLQYNHNIGVGITRRF